MTKQSILVTLLILWVVVGSGIAAQDDEPDTGTLYLYAAETLNMRDCPRLDCAIVESIPKGEPLLPLGTETGSPVNESEIWQWVEVPETGVRGVVHESLVMDYAARFWREMPVVPVVDESMREIYQTGLELGNNPNAFSVVGDCQNVTAYFLADFETPALYRLGDTYADLQETIDQFTGSFGRERAAVRGGYNVASVLSPLWADPTMCEKGESPLDCEYRLQRPSLVLISMETWWEGQPVDAYEHYLGQVVAFWLDHGVVPILATKADNIEGDHSINAAIARVALAYDVPLWNFWLAVQPLPDSGLTDDGFHLTLGRPFFDDSAALQSGWAMRNLTALQALDAVWKSVRDDTG